MTTKMKLWTDEYILQVIFMWLLTNGSFPWGVLFANFNRETAGEGCKLAIAVNAL